MEEVRASVDSAVHSYVANHFTEGASSTFYVKESDEEKIVIALVGKKYNPTNFW
jgi:hypothetical protein